MPKKSVDQYKVLQDKEASVNITVISIQDESLVVIDNFSVTVLASTLKEEVRKRLGWHTIPLCHIVLSDAKKLFIRSHLQGP